ncbi:MAG: nuclear transport factor 2 family protein [Deltaproteobacteria bacterium]|nr:MAG: nuclear transport factor 2 family protein [Deltaproteobacteria bacterium]
MPSAADFVDGFRRFWSAPSLDGFATVLAPDVKLVQPLAPPMRGLDAVRRTFRPIFVWLPDIRGEVERWSSGAAAMCRADPTGFSSPAVVLRTHAVHGGRARQLLRRAPAPRGRRGAAIRLAAAVAIGRGDVAPETRKGRARCAPSTALTSSWPSTPTSTRSRSTGSPATAASSAAATSRPERSGARRPSRPGRRTSPRASSPPCSTPLAHASRRTSRASSRRNSSSATA